MRPIRSLLLYLALVFLGAACLSPWLYEVSQWAAKHFSACEGLARQPFHRYVNRSLLGLALLGLWPFLRGLRANSWRNVGIVKPAGHWRKGVAGFAIGFASLACVAALAVAVGARKFAFDPSDFLAKSLMAGASALGVAILEELLFRGALFGALRQAHHWIVALFISSTIYALVHFFQRPLPPPEITWSSGFGTLWQMMRGFGDVATLVPGFPTLTLAGMILALGYQRTGNLYFSIGLHAGWIFCLKWYGLTTLQQPKANTWIWGTDKLIDGWIALLVLAFLFVGLYLSAPKRDSGSHAG